MYINFTHVYKCVCVHMCVCLNICVCMFEYIYVCTYEPRMYRYIQYVCVNIYIICMCDYIENMYV